VTATSQPIGSNGLGRFASATIACSLVGGRLDVTNSAYLTLRIFDVQRAARAGGSISHIRLPERQRIADTRQLSYRRILCTPSCETQLTATSALYAPRVDNIILSFSRYRSNPKNIYLAMSSSVLSLFNKSILFAVFWIVAACLCLQLAAADGGVTGNANTTQVQVQHHVGLMDATLAANEVSNDRADNQFVDGCYHKRWPTL